MHGEELAASRALDEAQAQGALCSLVLELAAWISFYESLGSIGAVRLDFAFTACCPLAASMRPSSTHSRSAAAVHPVPYVYDMLRLASVGFYATLWYTHL